MRNSQLYALFMRFLQVLLKKRIADSDADPENLDDSTEKYFSIMLDDLFSRLGNKESSQNTDSKPDAENPMEFESNPLTDLLKSRRESETEDAHEDPNGKVQSIRNSGETGEELAQDMGDGSGHVSEKSESDDNLSGRSSEKLGKTSQQSRISAKLSDLVSESNVPECVVFNGIGEATHIFDWRRILRQNGSFDVDWSYRNAVVEDGIVRPTLEQIPVAVTEILLDTSGSIDEPLLKRFLQECRNILPYSKVKIGCFDTQFYGFKEINSLSDLESMVFEGRHGTSFSAAVNAFSGRADNRIIFTDGDAPMPSQRMDIIWIVFGGKRIRPNGGRVFYVDDDLLKRLKS